MRCCICSSDLLGQSFLIGQRSLFWVSCVLWARVVLRGLPGVRKFIQYVLPGLGHALFIYYWFWLPLHFTRCTQTCLYSYKAESLYWSMYTLVYSIWAALFTQPGLFSFVCASRHIVLSCLPLWVPLLCVCVCGGGCPPPFLCGGGGFVWRYLGGLVDSLHSSLICLVSAGSWDGPRYDAHENTVLCKYNQCN